MKKKIIALMTACMLATTALVGCSADSETLKVGTNIGYPPFEYFDVDGTTPIGVDIELAYAIGEELGMEVEIVNTAWDGIFAGLDKGDYDLILSAVTITPDRLLDYSFSTPYIQNYQSIVSLVGGEYQITDPSEFDGLRVAYQEETTSDIYLTEYIATNGITVETYEYANVMDCFTELEFGRVDAIIVDSTVANSYTGEGSSFDITWQQNENPEEFAVCIKQDNTELTEQVNTALEALKADGTLDEILTKYF